MDARVSLLLSAVIFTLADSRLHLFRIPAHHLDNLISSANLLYQYNVLTFHLTIATTTRASHSRSS